MAILVKHSKVSTIPDDADTSLVRPSDWNADHTLTGTIEIVNGGTGQTTASAAFDALAPSQTGNTGKYLTTNGTTTSWATVSGGSGTVTSVAATAGTGISISGSPITTSGTLTITNTAPDQTVSIANGTGISATGTYPAFTVTNTGVTSAVAGTGISVSGATGAVTVTNTSPDQTVAIASGTGISVTGTYPNFTVTNTSPSSGGTVTSVTGTSPVVSSGGNTPAISMPAATTSVNGYLTSTDWTTFNAKGNGTVTSVAAITLGTTGTDLSSTVANGTTTPVITLQVPTASATNRGALSAADWTTFNNKGTGTVTAVSVTSANGFAGTSSGGATPALTLTTSITGVLKGDGTAISAATAGTDYSAGTSALSTGILKSTTTTGALTIAVAADFPTLNQNTTGSAGSVTNALTAGTGLSATATYNGSAAITFNATGTTINSQTSGYTLVATDAGKTISITTGGVTIPNAVMAAGNIVSIYNNSGSSQTITQGTSLTLQFAGQSSSTTGNRTLGLYGLCTIVFISSSNAVISGSGIT